MENNYSMVLAGYSNGGGEISKAEERHRTDVAIWLEVPQMRGWLCDGPRRWFMSAVS